MKEDYLWDKTGQDSEIERLENALQAFRYQATAAPKLPAKIIPFENIEKKSSHSFFRFSFASAALAALMIACLGVWLQYSSEKIEVAKNLPETKKTEAVKDSTETIAPQIDKEISDKILIKKQPDSVIEKPEIRKQSTKRDIVKIRKTVPPIDRRNDSIARNVEAEKPAVKLTDEEKYAYSQLMLALSITGSKLKLVRDKIDGVKEQKVVLENNR